jgi:anti-sigma regulatory factor (Ser/Thr protein kinase)
MPPIAAKQPRTKRKVEKLGRAPMLQLEVRSQPAMLCVVRGALEPMMETLGFSEEQNRAIIRGVDEAVSNIMRHSYRGCPDKLIELRCNRLERRVSGQIERGMEILLFDCGPAVDTTKIQPRPLDEIRPGGLGLHIIRSSMDAVEYRRAGRMNRLRLVKWAGPGSQGKSSCLEETPK